MLYFAVRASTYVVEYLKFIHKFSVSFLRNFNFVGEVHTGILLEEFLVSQVEVFLLLASGVDVSKINGRLYHYVVS